MSDEWAQAIIGIGLVILVILLIYLPMRWTSWKKRQILKELGYEYHPQGYTIWSYKDPFSASEYIDSHPGWIKEINGKLYSIEDPVPIIEFPSTMRNRILASELSLCKEGLNGGENKCRS